MTTQHKILQNKIEVFLFSKGQLQAPKHGEWFMSLFGEVLAVAFNAVAVTHTPPSTHSPSSSPTSPELPPVSQPHFSLPAAAEQPRYCKH